MRHLDYEARWSQINLFSISRWAVFEQNEWTMQWTFLSFLLHFQNQLDWSYGASLMSRFLQQHSSVWNTQGKCRPTCLYKNQLKSCLRERSLNFAQQSNHGVQSEWYMDSISIQDPEQSFKRLKSSPSPGKPPNARSSYQWPHWICRKVKLLRDVWSGC